LFKSFIRGFLLKFYFYPELGGDHINIYLITRDRGSAF
jgi:hypothetical protein